jgi:4-hydroxy-3-polyprenylbenzoate decarboxylase
VLIHKETKDMVLVIGITGASGVIYGIRLLEVLASMGNVETHLIISEAAELVIRHETDWKIENIRSLASYSYRNNEMGACLASGSFDRDGMIVAPCTVKTMSALANSYADNLLVRAGDVALKERKKLLLLVRETPLHIGHIRTMERLTEMGAIIMPPVPSFYHKPKTVDELVNHTVGKMLGVFGIKHNLFEQWPGLSDQVESTQS